MSVTQMRIVELDEGWSYMQVGIAKLKSILEESAESQFSSEEYMMLYTYPFIWKPSGLWVLIHLLQDSQSFSPYICNNLFLKQMIVFYLLIISFLVYP